MVWLVMMTRRQHSMLPGQEPMLPCIRGRETSWPPLWPVRRLSGAQGTGYPESLYPDKQYTQLRQEKTSKDQVEVAEMAGKTSVPTRTAS